MFDVVFDVKQNYLLKSLEFVDVNDDLFHLNELVYYLNQYHDKKDPNDL